MIWGSNGVESMSSNRQLIESGGARATSTLAYYCLSGWDGHLFVAARKLNILLNMRLMR